MVEFKKKSFIINNWGIIKGVAKMDKRKVKRGKGESKEKRLKRIKNKRRQREGLL